MFHLSRSFQSLTKHICQPSTAIASTEATTSDYKMQRQQQSPFFDDLHEALYHRCLAALTRKYADQHNLQQEQVPADVSSRLKHMAFSISHKERQGPQGQRLHENMLKKQHNPAPTLSLPAASPQAQARATQHDIVESGPLVTQTLSQILPTAQLPLPQIPWQSALSSSTYPTPFRDLAPAKIEGNDAPAPSAMADSSPLKGKGNASQYDFKDSPAHASDAYTAASPRSSSPGYWLPSPTRRPNFSQPPAQLIAQSQPPSGPTPFTHEPHLPIYAARTTINIGNGVRERIARLNAMDPEANKLNAEFCYARLNVSADINEILLIRTGLNGINLALLSNNIEAIRGSVRHAAAKLQQMLPQLQDFVRSITQWIVDPDWRWVAQWRALNAFYDCFSSLKAQLAKHDKMYHGNDLTLVDELQFTRAQVLDVIKPQLDDDLTM